MKLEGKVAIVTGAARGNGKGFALGLAREGANVSIMDIRGEEAEATAREIRGLGREAIVVVGGVTRLSDIETTVKQTTERFGKIDILVNNAGIYPPAPFLEKTETEVDLVFATNLKGPYFCTQYVAKYMANRGSKGSIINISSSHSFIGLPMGVVDYTATKGGLNALTRATAAELAPYGIRVNAIALGLTKTPGVEEMPIPGGIEGLEKAISSSLLISRLAVPEDYVGLLVWLASEESSFCTGSTFIVDGGLVNSFVMPPPPSA